MDIKIFDDYQTLSIATALQIVDTVSRHSNAVLCLAAGNTPALTYDFVVRLSRERDVDFSQVTFIGLDEWVGVAPGNSGSCACFLNQHIFVPLSISAKRIFLFDALAPDLEFECVKMNDTIARVNGIDLMLVGVGMNGHIGFNEPGATSSSYAHVVLLDETTQSVGQKYFDTDMKIGTGITLGVAQLLESKKVMVIASGTSKASIIKRALDGAISGDVPASYVRMHANSACMLDKAAASLIS